MLEPFPVTSVFLSKQAGRTAADKKLHYTRQTSSVLVAHKTSDYTCNGPGPQLEPPRQRPLELVGVVVSQKHPPPATFLPPAMAEHLLTRYFWGEGGGEG